MRLARWLLELSAIVFAVTGVAYLLVPGTALGIVGIASAPTSDFLLRTEGVALVTTAILLWAIRDASIVVVRTALIALTFYLVVGSLLDLEAFARGIVGPASIPSAIARIALGLACLYTLVRRGDGLG